MGKISRLRVLIRNYGMVKSCRIVRNKILSSSRFQKKKIVAIIRNSIKESKLKEERKTKFPYEPSFGILVPLYNTDSDMLKCVIESVIKQSYSNWELCLYNGSGNENTSVDEICREYCSRDVRIKYRVGNNLGISENTNECAKMTNSEYLGLLDHDDILHPSALFEVTKTLNENKYDFIYTDEVTFSKKITNVVSTNFKPDYSPESLRCNNYICHFLVMKRKLLEQAGGFRGEYDGAQDFDLVLRLTEAANCIVHIPKILYHWRSHDASTAANPMSKLYAYEAGRRAVESHLERCGEPGVVSDTRFYGFYQTTYAIPEKYSVNLVFFSCEGENHKKILNNFSSDFHRQKAGNVIYYDNGFNKFVIFSKEQEIEGEVLIFAEAGLGNVSVEALQQLSVNCLRDGIGMAGGRILSGKGELLYGRMEPDKEGRLVYADAGLPKGFTGYFHKAILQQNTEAVSHRLFAVRTDLLKQWEPEISGTSEELMRQLCSYVKKSGYRIAYVPLATANRKRDG